MTSCTELQSRTVNAYDARIITRNSATADGPRDVSQNLANCRNKLYDKSTTNRIELEGYS